jgi:TnpA family transposase
VAAYTFRDERDLLWYSTVFSSAERESAYVIDGLMHNEVVKSDIHSTDAFGFSELVFAVSHLLSFSYAPRFKNLKRQRLYIFKNRKALDRSSWKIKPAGYADDEIVIQQWDDILRMIATIKLKEVTASDLFRRLNSYSKQHTLYQALKAFGQVPKSLFILQVIDDPVLRQAIEKQMDRIEHVPLHARRLGRQSAGISTGGERGPGDGGSLQAAHQKLHHLLELSLPVAKAGRDRGCREPGGVSRCGGPRLGDFLAAHQPAGRV